MSDLGLGLPRQSAFTVSASSSVTTVDMPHEAFYPAVSSELDLDSFSSNVSLPLGSDASRSRRVGARLRARTLAVLAAARDSATVQWHKTPLAVHKGRKPKFELHLKIYDLNNVPLVSGSCFVKYHLAHSLHNEHRGRTQKCPVINHRVDFGPCPRLISPIRIAVDRSSLLSECPFELEVVQELDVDAGARGGEDKNIRLGTVRLNLSEYVEESEAVARELSSMLATPTLLSSPSGAAWAGGGGAGAAADSSTTTTTTATTGVGGASPPTARNRTSSLSTSLSNGTPVVSNTRPASAAAGSSMASADSAANGSSGNKQSNTLRNDCAEVQDGIIRRYLLQGSKINSTLRVSVLMVQVDGDRNYVAPSLRTAPVFGGIAGLLTGDQSEQPDEAGQVATTSRSKDVNSEVYDMYRRSLAASWCRQPDELPADECIEDIFAGGDGWRRDPHSATSHQSDSNNPNNSNNNNHNRNNINNTLLSPLPVSTPPLSAGSVTSPSSLFAFSSRSQRKGSLVPSLDGEYSGSSNASTDTVRPHHGSHFLQVPTKHFGSANSGAASAASPSPSPKDPTFHGHSIPLHRFGTGLGSKTQPQPQNQGGQTPPDQHHHHGLLHRRKHSASSDEPARLWALAAGASSAPSLGDLGQQRGGRGPAHADEASSIATVAGFGRERQGSFGGGGGGSSGSGGGGGGNENGGAASRSRQNSFVSLAPSSRLAIEDGDYGGEVWSRRPREVDEMQARDNLVAWSMR